MRNPENEWNQSFGGLTGDRMLVGAVYGLNLSRKNFSELRVTGSLMGDIDKGKESDCLNPKALLWLS